MSRTPASSARRFFSTPLSFMGLPPFRSDREDEHVGACPPALAPGCFGTTERFFGQRDPTSRSGRVKPSGGGCIRPPELDLAAPREKRRRSLFRLACLHS